MYLTLSLVIVKFSNKRERYSGRMSIIICISWIFIMITDICLDLWSFSCVDNKCFGRHKPYSCLVQCGKRMKGRTWFRLPVPAGTVNVFTPVMGFYRLEVVARIYRIQLFPFQSLPVCDNDIISEIVMISDETKTVNWLKNCVLYF